MADIGIPQLLFLFLPLLLPKEMSNGRHCTSNWARGKCILSEGVFLPITQHKHLLVLHKHNSDLVNIHICVFIVFFPIFGSICVLLVIVVYKHKFYCFTGIYIVKYLVHSNMGFPLYKIKNKETSHWVGKLSPKVLSCLEPMIFRLSSVKLCIYS